jgi:mannan endo-1,4-beta-mannosidase
VALVSAVVLIAGSYVIADHSGPDAKQWDRAPLSTMQDSYLGVAEANEIASYRPIDEFAAAVGRQPNIVLYYSRWDDPFETRLAMAAHAHDAVPFVQINPGRTTMAAVAQGRYDAYLRYYANQVRAFGYPVIVGFAPEMNAVWNPWGYRHTSPTTWIAAWRHVVTIFRQQGATNVTWLWTINAGTGGTGPIQDWWPGSQYVTWVGIDGYYFYSASTFATVFDPTLNDVRAITDKPVLLSETAIGQVAGQATKMPDLFDGIQAANVVGFVWFDQNQDAGVYHQRWRLETDPAGLAAFRRELQNYG